jgi:hypothetical protein
MLAEPGSHRQFSCGVSVEERSGWLMLCVRMEPILIELLVCGWLHMRHTSLHANVNNVSTQKV